MIIYFLIIFRNRASTSVFQKLNMRLEAWLK